MMSCEHLRIAIRADASSEIGTGHIFRSIAIFERWRERGDHCFFVCARTPGHMIDYLRDRAFEVHEIPKLEDPAADADAFISTIEAAGGVNVAWVDHYGLGVEWEVRVRSNAVRLCAVDDLANRPHRCDLFLDSSHESGEATVYDDLLPAECSRLIGQDFVPLRREFTTQSKPQRRPADPVQRLLVTLGGNDPLNASSLVLEALDHPTFQGLAVDLTAGRANPRLSALQEQADAMAGVKIHIQHERMADLMAKADICIGAGGTTSWERCYMALPTLGLVLAENQVDPMKRLEKLGVARNLGWANRLTADQLRAHLAAAIGDANWRTRTSLAASRLVDGKGVARILNAVASMMSSDAAGCPTR